MKFKNFSAGLVAIFALSAVLAMCGKDVKQAVGIKSGNGGGNSGGSTGAPAVSWGVMKKGSVIVNGVTFDPAAAEIIHDDSPASDALLQDGMNVKVRGRLNPDNVTGAADKIRSDSEVRGTIVAKGVDSITLYSISRSSLTAGPYSRIILTSQASSPYHGPCGRGPRHKGPAEQAPGDPHRGP